ncbi:LysR family transcriptional regulator [Agarilytica rhodophyticola]|uniref:LysR family transcriptional regulator n=1 Tax=Agarilytica rhodophyticola TaxID=1737490 RepID=UPI000B346765|nr:LysR family transcriptional regulator [Agarilytica rhodophyticola]
MSMFEGITEFIAVAETQGFSSAARRLNVSTSHVSRRIADLEARLGIALVARSTRQVKLTNAGVIYYERCVDLVHGLDQANEILTAGQIELSGVLRVTAAGEFAEKNVIPVLIEFIAQHPKLTLELDYNTRMVNFVEESFDFAIRFGSLPDSNLIARKLSDHNYITAASPEYLYNFGRPETPQDLSAHSCIVTTYNRWPFVCDNKTIEVSVNGRIKANSVRTVVNACKAGLGIAYMPITSFGDTIENKQLESVLSGYWKNRGSTWIVYANRRYLSAKARMAIDFLLSRFQDNPL